MIDDPVLINLLCGVYVSKFGSECHWNSGAVKIGCRYHDKYVPGTNARQLFRVVPNEIRHQKQPSVPLHESTPRGHFAAAFFESECVLLTK
jgi:hypothetical protein